MTNDPRFAEGSFDDLKAWVAKPEWIHFACVAHRPGLQECMSTLENTHYDPKDKAKNDLFEVRIIHWQALPFVLISIPKDDRPHMERAAAANGLRIADGTPTMISGDASGHPKVDHFPAQGANVFTLENIAGHPVYTRTMRRLREELAKRDPK